ncbi:PREDICTED: cytochrome P450 4C1-like isoform X2 [Polistes dominula]|uniref:Cytochrome P450 4C1-like isoform X2 n=1 Tax=Polistes dominula TaxID=743375 RepID=A0ABM1IGL6_POLDO|nr:PREDICTED: cytochrome P450 4C1-like isoform X2 [Polistes dominula]
MYTYLMMLSILLSFILFLILLHCFIRYRRVGRLISLLPGPQEYPIIGNLHHVHTDNEHLLQQIWKLSKENYPIFKIWTLFFSAVILLDPDDIQELLKSNEYLEKGDMYKSLMPWLSSGLLISGGEKWHLRRKMLTPAFHFNILKHSFTNLIKESQNLVESLQKEGDGNPIIKDLRTFISKYTLNAICQIALGTHLTEKNELESEYRNAVHVYGRIATYRMIRPWYYFDTIFAFSPLGRVQKKILKTLHSFSRNIIAERKRFHKQTNGKYLQVNENIEEDDVSNKNSEKDNDYFQSKKRLSMLDLLIAASWNDNQIDEEGICEEVDTFIFEGHDTTASALTSTLSLIAKHKDVQENIRDEVRLIMQEDNNVTISSLSKLPYLERCLKESLRLYPSVHSIFRQIPHDMQLKHYLIPSGTIIEVNIYSLHRNPDYWPNPDVFDPDRFLPENVKGRHPYSYIPFSAGPRNCIGQKLAMYELKLMVAFILYNFKLEPVDELDDVTFLADLTLTSSKPLRIKFIPIT